MIQAKNMSAATHKTTENVQKKPEHVNRACEPCRLLKVRCLPSPDPSTTQCQRCAKNGRTCHYAAPQKRRPRKRTDTRVAELEREVRAMRSLLNKSKQSPSGDSSHDLNPTIEEGDETDELLRKASVPSISKSFATQKGPQWGCPGAEHDYEPSEGGAERTPDVIERDLIGAEMAQEYFDHYNNNMLQHAPLVAFRPEETADQVRANKPILFLTILTAVAGQKNHTLYLTLHEEVLQTFADRYIINCEKSLELVEAFLVTSIWLYPPNDFRSLKYYQYIHMAASMSLDIGQPEIPGIMQKNHWQADISDSFLKNTTHEYFKKLGDNHPSGKDTGVPQNILQKLLVLESKRTHLGCYLLCSTVAMSLRRPNMLTFSAFTSGCIDYLTNSPYALYSDKLLIVWVQLQHIAEDSGASFSFDDLSNKVEMSDPRMQFTLKGFENRLEDYRKTIDPSLMSPSLNIHYYMGRIFLQEYAIMLKNADGFQAGELIDMGVKRKPISTASANAIMTVIESAHLLIDAFFSADDDILKCFPVVNYVRMTYAMVLLIKMFATASLPDSELGKILDVSTLKIEHYLRLAVSRLKNITAYRAASKFLQVVLKVAMYHQQRLNNAMASMGQAKGQSQLVQPLLNMVVNEHDKVSRVMEPTHQAGKDKMASDAKNEHSHRSSKPKDNNNCFEPYFSASFNVGRYLDPNDSSTSPENDSTAGHSTHTTSASTATMATDLSGFGNTEDPAQQQWFQPSANFSNGLLPTDMDVDIFALSEGMEFTTDDLSWMPLIDASKETQLFDNTHDWGNWGN